MKKLSGSCLCGIVTFECDDEFSEFHFCHCVQCQKATGSAHVSNLFTGKHNLRWLSGEDSIKRYDQPGRTISNAFCEHCGSRVPYKTESGNSVLVPAGVLDDNPNMAPQDNIFWSERAQWYDTGLKSKKYEGFPGSDT